MAACKLESQGLLRKQVLQDVDADTLLDALKFC